MNDTPIQITRNGSVIGSFSRQQITEKLAHGDLKPTDCFYSADLGGLPKPLSDINSSIPLSTTSDATLVPSANAAVSNPPIRQIHKHMTEYRASKCEKCGSIFTPAAPKCQQCGADTVDTEAVIRFLPERVAFYCCMVVFLYVALIVAAFTAPNFKFEPVMLIIPPIGVFSFIFCLGYLGFPIRFNVLFESSAIQPWANLEFSWLRFSKEFIYFLGFWLISALIGAGVALFTVLAKSHK